jgi:hypothetical protein
LIVLLLISTMGAMIFGLTDTKDPATLAPVTIDEGAFYLEVTVQSTRGDADHLEIRKNGNTQFIWEDYEAGETRTVQCAGPGDRISVLSVDDDDSYVVQRYDVQSQNACEFDISQPGTSSFTAGPINWGTGGDVEEFYSYGGSDGTGHPHAHMDPDSPYVENDKSYVFFYEIDGEISLVFVHDKPEQHCTSGGEDHSDLGHIDGACYPGTTTDGGAAMFEFDGLPSSGRWVIQDDPHDWDFGESPKVTGAFDPSDVSWASQNCPPDTACWSWNEKNTDGGAYAGGFTDSDGVHIEITPHWGSAAIGNGHWNDDHVVTDWVFLYRSEDGIESVSLDMSEPLVIEGYEQSP